MVDNLSSKLDAWGGMPPSVVLDFAEYLARLVAAQYSLTQHLARVHLCTTRLLLRMVQPALWPAFVRQNAPRDAHLVHQQHWMRALPPEQLGVEARFCGTRARPPLTAASVLGDFCFLSAPVDQLLCLYRVVSLVHALAVDTSEGEVTASDIGADTLLPLLVWTVVHASIPHAFSALEYAKQLSTREHSISELGYYLACLEAACAYVADASPAAAGAPADGIASELPQPEAAAAAVTAGSAMEEAGAHVDQTQPLEAIPLAPQHSPPQPHANGASNPSVVVAEREALAMFLQEERDVDDLVGALAL